MSIIFDGKAYAAKKILELDGQVALLKNKGIHPKIASILVGDDPAGRLYVSLKKKRGESIGIEMDVYYFKESELLENIFNSWKNLKFSENTIKHFHQELLKYAEKDEKN